MLPFLYSVIFSTLLSVGVAEAEETPPPNENRKAIESQEEVQTEKEVWGVESIERASTIHPSNWGHAGIFRVRSAESLPVSTLSFGVGGEFYSISNAPDFGTGKDAKTIAESLFVGYAPIDHLTIGVMRRNSSTTFGEPQQLISSLGDFNFSALYSVPLNPSMAVAPIFNFLVASNFNNLAPSGSTVSVGLGAAFTYTLFPSLGIPLFAHFNALYHMPQIRTSKGQTLEPETYFNFSRYHTVTLGLGLEYQVGDFTPFLEFQNTVQTNSSLSFGQSPSKISIGSRVTPLANKSLAILLGADIGLGKGLVAGTPYQPDYQILGQISYTVAMSNTERKHYYTTSDVNIVDRKFIINKNINFKVGSAELEKNSTFLLDQIADVIKQNKIKKLMIVGHTDSSAPEDYNMRLSNARAGSVKQYMVNQGIAEEIFMTQGYGKRKPKASNLTDEGRALNRRVEFFILE